MGIESMRRRIIEISYNHKLSHVGSCLSALPILCEIYAKKKPEEKFILDAGHAHLAHAVVMEANGGGDAVEKIQTLGIHCDRRGGCDVSTGSLGQGLPIAVGIALADRSKNTFCLVSDGGSAEGSIFEALRIAKEQNLTNLKIYLNANGTGGLGEIDIDYLERRIKAFGFPVEIRRTDAGLGSWAQGVAQHYKIADEELYGISYLKDTNGQILVKNIKESCRTGLDCAANVTMSSMTWGTKYGFQGEKMEQLTTEKRHDSMRGWFFWSLYNAMVKDKSIWGITADLGYGGFDRIQKDFPDRFVNTGAAEASMLGIAVGLALEQKRVFTYTITSFYLRCAETIALYVAGEGIPVRMVGSGVDDSYKHDGPSHHGRNAQDYMKMLGIESLYPQNKEEVPGLVEKMVKDEKPVFIGLQR